MVAEEAGPLIAGTYVNPDPKQGPPVALPSVLVLFLATSMAAVDACHMAYQLLQALPASRTDGRTAMLNAGMLSVCRSVPWFVLPFLVVSKAHPRPREVPLAAFLATPVALAVGRAVWMLALRRLPPRYPGLDRLHRAQCALAIADVACGLLASGLAIWNACAASFDWMWLLLPLLPCALNRSLQTMVERTVAL
jgi:hypothetical protein